MRKSLLAVILCCILLLSSCGVSSENPVDLETISETFTEEITEPTTEKPSYTVDYFDMTTYEIVEELGENYVLLGYSGGSNLCFSEFEFVLGQIYNFSGREKVLSIIVNGDKQLDENLFSNMTYSELSEALGERVSEPEFYENLMEDILAYQCSFEYNGYSYVFEWQCDDASQIEYNDRACDSVIIHANREVERFDDCLFDYGSREEAKEKIDLEAIGYEGCKIVEPEKETEQIFINNNKYYVFSLYAYDGTGVRHIINVFASATTDDLYLGHFYENAEPEFTDYYDGVLTDLSKDEFIYYGTTEQNCYRYYTKDFKQKTV